MELKQNFKLTKTSLKANIKKINNNALTILYWQNKHYKWHLQEMELSLGLPYFVFYCMKVFTICVCIYFLLKGNQGNYFAC